MRPHFRVSLGLQTVNLKTLLCCGFGDKTILSIPDFLTANAIFVTLRVDLPILFLKLIKILAWIKPDYGNSLPLPRGFFKMSHAISQKG